MGDDHAGARVLKPLGDRILVRRTEGHGIEKVLASGIVLPATREKSIQTRGDYFRARVEALSEKAARALPDLAVGEDVLVYSYSGTDTSVFTGDDAAGGLCIRPDDIIGVVSGD